MIGRSAVSSIAEDRAAAAGFGASGISLDLTLVWLFY
jgi:hypothetical protein